VIEKSVDFQKKQLNNENDYIAFGVFF